MRFEFGRNWLRYATLLDEQRIAAAEQSLRDMLDMKDFQGMRFLDVGSGSGLFSLAARRLGAEVFSFDFDPEAVACTKSLRDRYFPGDPDWQIQRGDILDQNFVESLDPFHVVYSWGVLHHTGAIWSAIRNVTGLVCEDGVLFIAIYNDQGLPSSYWRIVKRLYNLSSLSRLLMICFHAPHLYVLRWVVRVIMHRGNLHRGMDLWRDMLDWLGGYPFEVAKPEDIFNFVKGCGYRLQNMKTCGGRHGCNEFIFRREWQ